MTAMVHPASLGRSHRPLSARSRKIAAAAACAAIALAYLAVGWWIVFDIRVGPVVASLTDTQGVHSGDFLGLASFLLGLGFALGSAMLLESGLARPRMAVGHYR